jgi:hypothetical protein
MGTVMGVHHHRGGTWRSIAFALIALAVLIRTAVPQGTMISTGGGTAYVVICTGHGSLVPSSSRGDDHRSPRTPSDRQCALDGLVTSAGPPQAPGLPERATTYTAVDASAPVVDILPGRGLAAPPPPSHGPPAVLI